MTAQPTELPQPAPTEPQSLEADATDIITDTMLAEYSQHANQPRTLSTPTAPTETEQKLHCLTHLPYREWCTHCVSLEKAKPLITRH